MMNELVNGEFQQNNGLDQWSEAVIKELKGAPLHSLHMQDEVGIDQVPYLKEAPSLHLHPVRNWQPMQTFVSSQRHANERILDSLLGGSAAIGLNLHSESESSSWDCLKGVMPEMISLHFRGTTDSTWQSWKQYCAEQNVPLEKTTGTLDLNSLSLSPELITSLTEAKRNEGRNWRFFSVSSNSSANTSTHPIHEVAWLLRQGHEQFVHLMNCGASPQEAADMLSFRIDLGESYFLEIAKIRAFRYLWNQLLVAYGCHAPQQTNPCILGVSSAYLQTRQDPYNNLLRATTQSMSAILGGCQFVEALPYDAYTGDSSDHAYRMGRNILQLLVEEGKINEAVQAADGAYYIESLTAQVAEKSWSCFQELDTLPLTEALIRLQVLSNNWTDSTQEKIAKGEKVIVGVNRYVDKSAELLDAKIPLRTTEP